MTNLSLMQCNMCGKESLLKEVKIEGVVMNVCMACAKYGEIINKPDYSSKKYAKFNSNNFKNKKNDLDEKESLVSNYGSLIKNKREKLGMKQEDLAKMLSEKESLIHRIEASSPAIGFGLAKKIQKALNIKLIQDNSQNKSALSSNSKDEAESMTLGDLIKSKMKKS